MSCGVVKVVLISVGSLDSELERLPNCNGIDREVDILPREKEAVLTTIIITERTISSAFKIPLNFSSISCILITVIIQDFYGLP